MDYKLIEGKGNYPGLPFRTKIIMRVLKSERGRQVSQRHVGTGEGSGRCAGRG